MAAADRVGREVLQKNSDLSGHAIVDIRKSIATDLQDVAQVHEEAFAGFFMTRLGPRFLREYYAAVLNYPGSIFYVAQREKRIVGFIAGFVNPAEFYRSLRSRRLRFAWAIALRMLTSAALLIRLFATMRLAGQRSTAPDNSESAELASIGVLPGEGGNGIGRRLVQVFCREAFSRKAGQVLLTTDTEDNSAVNQFYLSLGFKKDQDFVQHGNRPMTQYMVASEDWTVAEIASEGSSPR